MTTRAKMIRVSLLRLRFRNLKKDLLRKTKPGNPTLPGSPHNQCNPLQSMHNLSLATQYRPTQALPSNWKAWALVSIVGLSFAPISRYI